MTAMRRQRKILVAMILACMFLGGLVAAEYIHLSNDRQTPPIIVETPNTNASPLFSTNDHPLRTVGSVGAYGEIVKRPLFFASRRPPPKIIARSKPRPARTKPRPVKKRVAAIRKPAPRPERAPPDIRLTGVILSPKAKVAIVEISRDRSVAHLLEGQKIDGWTIKSILADSLVLESGKRIHRVPLHIEELQAPRQSSPPPRRAGLRPVNDRAYR